MKKKASAADDTKAIGSKTKATPQAVQADLRPLPPSPTPLNHEHAFENVGVVINYTGARDDVRAFEARVLSQLDEDNVEMYYDLQTDDDGVLKETTIISCCELIHAPMNAGGGFQTAAFAVETNVQFRLTVYDDEEDVRSGIEITAFADADFLNYKLYKDNFENYLHDWDDKMRNKLHLERQPEKPRYYPIAFD